MDYKETVKAGYNAIANRYLATRTGDSEDVRLLHELITRLPEGAKVLLWRGNSHQPDVE